MKKKLNYRRSVDGESKNDKTEGDSSQVSPQEPLKTSQTPQRHPSQRHRKC